MIFIDRNYFLIGSTKARHYNAILKAIFYKVDVGKLNERQIWKILPYFFQLLGKVGFCKFAVYFIFHVNIKKNCVISCKY